MTCSSQIALRQYVAEFPFIKKWVDGFKFPELIGVKVQKVDLDLLNSQPREKWFGNIMFALVDEHGIIVHMVREEKRVYGNRRFWYPTTWFGHLVPAQTVQEAIRDHQPITYVVCIDNSGDPPLKITIYKFPKGFVLDEFIAQKQRRVEDEVRQRIAKEIAAAADDNPHD